MSTLPHLVLDVCHSALLAPVDRVLHLHIPVAEAGIRAVAGGAERRPLVARSLCGGAVKAEARRGKLLPGEIGKLVQIKLSAGWREEA